MPLLHCSALLLVVAVGVDGDGERLLVDGATGDCVDEDGANHWLAVGARRNPHGDFDTNLNPLGALGTSDNAVYTSPSKRP